MTSLSGPFRIDRMEVPTFYVALTAHRSYSVTTDHVLVQTGYCEEPGTFRLGFVSRSTPFGQGTGFVFAIDEVVEASPDAVLRALRKSHPHGWGYRPVCDELISLSFHRIMSGGVRNWSELLGMDDTEMIRLERDTEARFKRLMRQWRKIARRQRALIRTALESRTRTTTTA